MLWLTFMTIGKGEAYTASCNNYSKKGSAEAELVEIDDVISQVLWTRLFLASKEKMFQSRQYSKTISTIFLAENARMSSLKRTGISGNYL